MPQVSEALCNFLHARKTPANADLIDRWSIDMETQVNVAAGNGEPVAGKRSTWSDGIDEWFNIFTVVLDLNGFKSLCRGDFWGAHPFRRLVDGPAF